MIKRLFTLFFLSAFAVAAQGPDRFKSVKVTEKLDTVGAAVEGTFPIPNGGILSDEHAGPFHNVRFVIKPPAGVDYDAVNDGKSALTPFSTINKALDSIEAENITAAGFCRNFTIFLGPGVHEVDPISQTLGLGARIVGMGTNSFFGTEIRASSSFTANDSMFRFAEDGNTFAHHMLLENLQINMMGRGRDAIVVSRGGYNAVIKNVTVKNTPRHGLLTLNSLVTLSVSDFTGSAVGFGQGSVYASPAMVEVSPGQWNVNITNTSGNVFVAGQTVRVSSQYPLPTGWTKHKDYYLYNDGGALRLANSPAGPALHASDAGGDPNPTKTVRLLGGNNIPDKDAVVFVDTATPGNFYLQTPLLRDWVVGDKVRFESLVPPTPLKNGVDYYIVNDGQLRISATLGGAPITVTDDGTGTIYMSDAYDPTADGSFIHVDNTIPIGTAYPDGVSTLNIFEMRNLQTDLCGRYVISIQERGGYAAAQLDGQSVTFDGGPRTITRNAGSWVTDGFTINTFVRVVGSNLEENDDVYYVTGVTALVLTLSNVYGTVVTDASANSAVKVYELGSDAGYLIQNLEAEVAYFDSPYIHDAIVAVNGSPDSCQTNLTMDNVTVHTAASNGDFRAIVKQLNTGDSKVRLTARNLIHDGLQYDYLYTTPDYQQSFERVGEFNVNAPSLHYSETPGTIAFATNYAVRSGASKGAARHRMSILHDGQIHWGSGTGDPTPGISGDGTFVYSHKPLVVTGGGTYTGNVAVNAGVLTVDGGAIFADGQPVVLGEVSAAPSGEADKAKIYAIEGPGPGFKTRLMVQFGTGAAIELAIEP